MKINRLAALLICVVLIFSVILSGCGKKDSAFDDSPITMYVGLGNNNGDYYDKIHDLVYDTYGVDVKFITSSLMDTSNAVLLQIKNYDLPADIVITAANTPADLQKNAFLDIASVSNILDNFSISEISKMSVDSAVYQIPFTSRLIGIEYNETLMNEMGWSVPKNFSEMADLKEKADAAGIKFAVSGGVATGHGFNYLFHLMGADYISSIEGTEWYKSFMDGSAPVDRFAVASDYFDRFKQAGLFGSIHDADWLAAGEFSQQRALFYFNILNDVSSYDGFKYNSAGRISGAKYDSNGKVVAVPNPDGNAVKIDDKFVLYNSNVDAHQGLDRYLIEGAEEVHDKYKSMPWLSEDGASNMYTSYYNMYVALDKKLLEPNQKHRLDNALKVLEVLATPEASKCFTDLYFDGYVPTTSFTPGDNAIYKNYMDSIRSGYTQPWYYNDFDNDSIVNVGDLVNRFIKGDAEVTIDTIMQELQIRRDNRLANKTESTSTISSNMNYSQSASVLAVAGTYSLKKALADSNITEEISLSILPYTESLSDIPRTKTPVGVVQSKFYQGDYYPSYVRTYISSGFNKVVAIHMSGEEVNYLLDQGYNIKKDFSVEKTFPYLSVQRGSGTIEPNVTYLVCVSPGCLDSDIYNAFLNKNKVILKNGVPVEGTVEEGLQMYALQNDIIDSSSLFWS